MAENRTIALLNEEGRQLAKVPLGKGGVKGFADIWKSDYDYLVGTLGLSGNWNKNSTGHVLAPLAGAPGSHVLVARVLLDAGVGQAVFVKDNDPTNLRRENLGIRPSKRGRDRPRQYLLAKGETQIIA